MLSKAEKTVLTKPAISAFAARKSLQNQTSKRSSASNGNQSLDGASRSTAASPAQSIAAKVVFQDDDNLNSTPALPPIQLHSVETALGNVGEDVESSYGYFDSTSENTRFLTGIQLSVRR